MKSHTSIMLFTMPCFCIDFILNVSKKPSGNKKNKIGLIVAIFVGAVGVLSFLFVFVVFFNTRKRKIFKPMIMTVSQKSYIAHQ